jgi:GT2 family glycosyltransferase
LLDNPGRIVPTGFNRALHVARGDIVIRIDGHCEVPPDYVRRCAESLAQTQADCVGGPLITVGVGLQANAIALAQSSRFGVGGASFRLRNVKPGFVDTVAFGAYRRDVFERIGMLDEELVRNQDDEFNFRLTQAGGRIWLDPEIHSIYYSRANLSKLWQQYFQYGLYKVRVIQKRGAVPARRHLAPAIFVLGVIGSCMLALLTSRPRWLLLVVGPYALANGLASLWTARGRWQTLPLLPSAFAVLHSAYGLGFLAGLWRWRRHGIPYLSLGADDS